MRVFFVATSMIFSLSCGSAELIVLNGEPTETDSSIQVVTQNAVFRTPANDQARAVTLVVPSYRQVALRNGLHVGRFAAGTVDVYLQPNQPMAVSVRDASGEGWAGTLQWQHDPGADLPENLGALPDSWLAKPTDGAIISGEKPLERGRVVWSTSTEFHDTMDALGIAFPWYRLQLQRELMAVVAPLLLGRIDGIVVTRRQPLDAQIVGLNGSLSEDRTTLAAIDVDLAALASDQGDQASRLNTEIAEFESLRDQVAALQETRRQQAGLPQDPAAALADARQAVADRDAQIEALEAELENLREPLADVANQIEALDERIRALELVRELYALSQDYPLDRTRQAAFQAQVDEKLDALMALDPSLAIRATTQFAQVEQTNRAVRQAFQALLSAINSYGQQNCSRNAASQSCLAVLGRLESAANRLRSLLDNYAQLLGLIENCDGSTLQCVDEAIATLEQQRDTLGADLEAQARAQEIEAELSELRDERSDLAAQLAELEASDQRIRDQLAMLQSRAVQQRSQLQAADAALDDASRLRLSESSQATLDYLQSGQAVQLAELDELAANLAEILQQLETELDSLSGQLEQLRANRSAIMSRISETEQSLTDAQEAIQSLTRNASRERDRVRVLAASVSPDWLGQLELDEASAAARTMFGASWPDVTHSDFRGQYRRLVGELMPILTPTTRLVTMPVGSLPEAEAIWGDLVDLLRQEPSVSGDPSTVGVFPAARWIYIDALDDLDGFWLTLLADNGVVPQTSAALPAHLRGLEVNAAWTLRLGSQPLLLMQVPPREGLSGDPLLVEPQAEDEVRLAQQTL